MPKPLQQAAAGSSDADKKPVYVHRSLQLPPTPPPSKIITPPTRIPAAGLPSGAGPGGLASPRFSFRTATNFPASSVAACISPLMSSLFPASADSSNGVRRQSGTSSSSSINRRNHSHSSERSTSLETLWPHDQRLKANERSSCASLASSTTAATAAAATATTTTAAATASATAAKSALVSEPTSRDPGSCDWKSVETNADSTSWNITRSSCSSSNRNNGNSTNPQLGAGMSSSSLSRSSSSSGAKKLSVTAAMTCDAVHSAFASQLRAPPAPHIAGRSSSRSSSSSRNNSRGSSSSSSNSSSSSSNNSNNIFSSNYRSEDSAGWTITQRLGSGSNSHSEGEMLLLQLNSSNNSASSHRDTHMHADQERSRSRNFPSYCNPTISSMLRTPSASYTDRNAGSHQLEEKNTLSAARGNTNSSSNSASRSSSSSSKETAAGGQHARQRSNRESRATKTTSSSCIRAPSLRGGGNSSSCSSSSSISISSSVSSRYSVQKAGRAGGPTAAAATGVPVGATTIGSRVGNSSSSTSRSSSSRSNSVRAGAAAAAARSVSRGGLMRRRVEGNRKHITTFDSKVQSSASRIPLMLISGNKSRSNTTNKEKEKEEEEAEDGKEEEEDQHRHQQQQQHTVAPAPILRTGHLTATTVTRNTSNTTRSTTPISSGTTTITTAQGKRDDKIRSPSDDNSNKLYSSINSNTSSFTDVCMDSNALAEQNNSGRLLQRRRPQTSAGPQQRRVPQLVIHGISPTAAETSSSFPSNSLAHTHAVDYISSNNTPCVGSPRTEHFSSTVAAGAAEPGAAGAGGGGGAAAEDRGPSFYSDENESKEKGRISTGGRRRRTAGSSRYSNSTAIEIPWALAPSSTKRRSSSGRLSLIGREKQLYSTPLLQQQMDGRQHQQQQQQQQFFAKRKQQQQEEEEQVCYAPLKQQQQQRSLWGVAEQQQQQQKRQWQGGDAIDIKEQQQQKQYKHWMQIDEQQQGPLLSTPQRHVDLMVQGIQQEEEEVEEDKKQQQWKHVVGRQQQKEQQPWFEYDPHFLSITSRNSEKLKQLAARSLLTDNFAAAAEAAAAAQAAAAAEAAAEVEEAAAAEARARNSSSSSRRRLRSSTLGLIGCEEWGTPAPLAATPILRRLNMHTQSSTSTRTNSSTAAAGAAVSGGLELEGNYTETRRQHRQIHQQQIMQQQYSQQQQSHQCHQQQEEEQQQRLLLQQQEEQQPPDTFMMWGGGRSVDDVCGQEHKYQRTLHLKEESAGAAALKTNDRHPSTFFELTERRGSAVSCMNSDNTYIAASRTHMSSNSSSNHNNNSNSATAPAVGAAAEEGSTSRRSNESSNHINLSASLSNSAAAVVAVTAAQSHPNSSNSSSNSSSRALRSNSLRTGHSSSTTTTTTATASWGEEWQTGSLLTADGGPATKHPVVLRRGASRVGKQGGKASSLPHLLQQQEEMAISTLAPVDNKRRWWFSSVNRMQRQQLQQREQQQLQQCEQQQQQREQQQQQGAGPRTQKTSMLRQLSAGKSRRRSPRINNTQSTAAFAPRSSFLSRQQQHPQSQQQQQYDSSLEQKKEKERLDIQKRQEDGKNVTYQREEEEETTVLQEQQQQHQQEQQVEQQQQEEKRFSSYFFQFDIIGRQRNAGKRPIARGTTAAAAGVGAVVVVQPPPPSPSAAAPLASAITDVGKKSRITLKEESTIINDSEKERVLRQAAAQRGGVQGTCGYYLTTREGLKTLLQRVGICMRTLLLLMLRLLTLSYDSISSGQARALFQQHFSPFIHMHDTTKETTHELLPHAQQEDKKGSQQKQQQRQHENEHQDGLIVRSDGDVYDLYAASLDNNESKAKQIVVGEPNSSRATAGAAAGAAKTAAGCSVAAALRTEGTTTTTNRFCAGRGVAEYENLHARRMPSRNKGSIITSTPVAEREKAAATSSYTTPAEICGETNVQTSSYGVAGSNRGAPEGETFVATRTTGATASAGGWLVAKMLFRFFSRRLNPTMALSDEQMKMKTRTTVQTEAAHRKNSDALVIDSESYAAVHLAEGESAAATTTTASSSTTTTTIRTTTTGCAATHVSAVNVEGTNEATATAVAAAADGGGGVAASAFGAAMSDTKGSKTRRSCVLLRRTLLLFLMVLLGLVGLITGIIVKSESRVSATVLLRRIFQQLLQQIDHENTGDDDYEEENYTNGSDILLEDVAFM